MIEFRNSRQSVEFKMIFFDWLQLNRGSSPTFFFAGWVHFLQCVVCTCVCGKPRVLPSSITPLCTTDELCYLVSDLCFLCKRSSCMLRRVIGSDPNDFNSWSLRVMFVIRLQSGCACRNKHLLQSSPFFKERPTIHGAGTTDIASVNDSIHAPLFQDWEWWYGQHLEKWSEFPSRKSTKLRPSFQLACSLSKEKAAFRRCHWLTGLSVADARRILSKQSLLETCQAITLLQA